MALPDTRRPGAVPDAASSSGPVLAVRGLKTWFETPAGTTRAVDGVDLAVGPGEIVAVVGESGSGKSVTALSVMKLVQVPPGRYVGGEARIEGRDVLALDERALEEVRGAQIGMIFQNPRGSLDPSFTIGAQIAEVLRRHHPGIADAEIESQASAVLKEVGFNDPARVMESYPHQLSGGMCQRIALVMALATRPRLLIADEPTTALDVGVQARILMLLKRKNRELNLPILVITHDFGVVAAIATRVVVMYAGLIQEEGTADELLAEPLHPYTQALIASVPDPDDDEFLLSPIPGEPPNLIDPPRGCRFAPRCEHRFARCEAEPPPLYEHGGRRVRCHLHDPAGQEK